MNPRHNKPAEAGLVHHRGMISLGLTIGANKRSVDASVTFIRDTEQYKKFSIFLPPCKYYWLHSVVGPQRLRFM